MKNIPDGSIDMILCDLPYGTTACKWDSQIDLENIWTQYERIIKDNGAIVLFGQEPFSSIVRLSRLRLYKYDWVWKKQKPSNFQLMNHQCGRVHENIMVFSKANACYVKNGNTMVYHPQMTPMEKVRRSNAKIYGNQESNILHPYKGGEKDNYKEYSERHPISVIEFNTESKRYHQAQKPVPLLEYLIRTYTNPGETVLDNCMGSGSTGIACLNTERDFIGIELDEHYFLVASERIDKHEGLK